VPVNKVVEDKFHSRQEGDTLVIPVFKEVITRHLVLLEEVRITTRRSAENNVQEVTLKREEAVVERYDAESGTWKPDSMR
jgi:stress response protein YsnF